MRRYVTRPRAVEAGDEYWTEERRTCDVFVPDGKPVDTGLLNADGTSIYRLEVRAPIGFMRDEEET